MSDEQQGAPDVPEIDFARLSYAWEAGEQYDADALSQPWDDPNIPLATNDVANGWACRIDRAILIEESTGRHVCELYDSTEDAERAWPEIERTYGVFEPQDDFDPPFEGEVIL